MELGILDCRIKHVTRGEIYNGLVFPKERHTYQDRNSRILNLLGDYECLKLPRIHGVEKQGFKQGASPSTSTEPKPRPRAFSSVHSDLNLRIHTGYRSRQLIDGVSWSCRCSRPAVRHSFPVAGTCSRSLGTRTQNFGRLRVTLLDGMTKNLARQHLVLQRLVRHHLHPVTVVRRLVVGLCHVTALAFSLRVLECPAIRARRGHVRSAANEAWAFVALASPLDVHKFLLHPEVLLIRVNVLHEVAILALPLALAVESLVALATHRSEAPIAPRLGDCCSGLSKSPL